MKIAHCRGLSVLSLLLACGVLSYLAAMRCAEKRRMIAHLEPISALVDLSQSRVQHFAFTNTVYQYSQLNLYLCVIGANVGTGTTTKAQAFSLEAYRIFVSGLTAHVRITDSAGVVLATATAPSGLTNPMISNYYLLTGLGCVPVGIYTLELVVKTPSASLRGFRQVLTGRYDLGGGLRYAMDPLWRWLSYALFTVAITLLMLRMCGWCCRARH